MSEAVTLYSFFKGNKDSFSKINTDKRCKVFPFKSFEDNIEKSWIIDKWWSEEEKIEIGISEKKEKVGLLEFSSLVEDIAVSISGFQEEIKELSEKKKSELTYSNFKLKDLFSIERGKSKYTKKFGNQNKGDFPVYSASNNAPLTYINSFDYNGEYLTWATNGFAGYIMVIDGKFSINADRGLLKPLKDNINISYVKYMLEPVLRDLAKGRKGDKGKDEFTKVYPSMIESVDIKMPIDRNGNFDASAQMEIVKKISFINDLKREIINYKQDIESTNIDIISSSKIKKIKLKEIFDIEKGKSKYTNKYINENRGNYHLYSSQTSNEGIIGLINSFDYDISAITWTTDGVHAGTVFKRNGKFSMTTHCGALVLKSEYIKKVSLNYIYHKLKESLKNYAVGEQNKRVTTTIIKDVIIDIPLNEKNEFDLNEQKRVSDKYQKIDDIKKKISNELKNLVETNIDYE